ncbi:hypothetical protein [Bdellovibrio sp. KM01]|uniref:hypothetical protein n=1 Tax=Bdellovibrio sp. KM01 TaxID=2748865 RepID=UPI0015E9949E|nr:hypothetical protein [Bdellovibrio sp. KM01]QLY25011.1 hypothetical protein HW988_16525 [Bdellovibrio sp. KM01]
MKKLFVAAALIASAFCSVASAKDYSSTSFTSYSSQPLNEVTTNLTTGYFFSGERCKDCDSGSDLTVNVSYLRYLTDGWQVGGEGGLQLLSKQFSGTGSSETLITLVGIGAYNFQSDIKTSMYAKAGVGLYPVLDGTSYKSQLGFFIGGGKRFQIFNSITYTPEVRLEKHGDLDMGISIAFLNFSLFWN